MPLTMPKIRFGKTTEILICLAALGVLAENVDLFRQNRQAFFPDVAVAADGTIGVSYYDSRFNDPNPGLPTDRWLARCQPSSTTGASSSACWGNEVRLTDTSFNMEAVTTIAFGEFWLGDYFGLTAAGDDFVAAFGAVDSQNITSIFARRVGP